MNENVKMIGKKLLVEPARQKDKTDGGILLPGTVTNNVHVTKGRVVATGDTEVKEGDTILFDANNGLQVSLDGKELMIVNEMQVHAVLK